MYCAKVREINDGVPVGVATPEVVGLGLGSAEEHRGFIDESDTGRSGLVVANNVCPCVPVGYDFGRWYEVGIASSMIAVVMGVENVFDWLVGHAADLFSDEIKAVGKFIVDNNDSIVRDSNRHVPAGLASVESWNHIQSVPNFSDLEACFLLWGESWTLWTAG